VTEDPQWPRASAWRATATWRPGSPSWASHCPGLKLDRLAQTCAELYVDLDVDVVDLAFVPGCPGARPAACCPQTCSPPPSRSGGTQTSAVDVVEVDARADPTGVTVDLAALCLLSVAAGFAVRPAGLPTSSFCTTT